MENSNRELPNACPGTYKSTKKKFIRKTGMIKASKIAIYAAKNSARFLTLSWIYILIYWLYRYVPQNRVWCLSFSVLK